ncbi:outer membrane protein assembly factor BamE [Pseudomonas mangiferae]|uniref:Outer membrane protein assembly factor BamE n=2 Tax=Pseudomonas mangiferae TaxID=2593654 RepID=A0A553GV14_9PSED|nr:outer membrane protein assembly factor BamE [Pseudomonas mangiferae]
MLGWLRVTLCALSLYPALPSSAATVFRCEDDSGHVLFTEQGCSHTATQTLQKADNPPPGGRLAQKGRGKSPPRRKHANASAGMHIVGIQEARTCGTGLSETERRRAQVRNEVRAGMSRKEVESSLGKPTRVSGQDGRMRYLYQDKRSGRQQVVSFDEDGCVKGKRR